MSKSECLGKCNVGEKNSLCCFKGKIATGSMRLKGKQVSTQCKIEYSNNQCLSTINQVVFFPQYFLW